MLISTRFSILLSLVLLSISTVQAQHDPQRDATRLIAQGKFAESAKVLQKANAAEIETLFVSMLSDLSQGDVAAGVAKAEQALAAGMPFGRLVAGPRDVLAPLYRTEKFQAWSREHAGLKLIHGPMLGNVTGTSADVWMRTAEAADVKVRVLDSTGELVMESKTTGTSADSDFTAVVRLSGLSPSSNYQYEVYVDGQRQNAENTRLQTSPHKHAAARFRVAFGGGAGYIPKWEYMWDTVLKMQPQAMLMLGDNVYIDAPTHNLTSRYCYYRRQSRPEWRRLVASTAMYSIYDDHDFGTNDCVPGPDIEKPAWKRQVWNAFRQNWCNPRYGGGPEHPGCWYDFYIGDVHFILLDGRYYRHRKNGTPSMLGPFQKRWLFETLQSSRGTFKVLASPVPWTPGIKPGSKDPWDGFPEEREEIFSFLEQHRINGVFLIAADRHRTDLRVIARDKGYDLYEFESSRLTNKHTHSVVKTPGLQWGYNKTCSFASMNFDTTADDPQVHFEAFTIDGKRMHQHVLRLSDLKH